MTNFEPFDLLNCCFYHDKSFINIKTFLVNKLAFLNFVPRLIKKIYHVCLTGFNRFACAIVVLAHISLITRLANGIV